MPWVLVLFLLPLVLFSVVVSRVIRLGRQLQDPEQLRSLFSDDVRAALLEANLDPDSVSMQEIQESEELSRLVAADLRRVLGSLVLGLRLPESRVSPDAARLRQMHRWSTEASRRAGQPLRPQPIGQSSGPEGRAIVVLVIVGLIAVATFVASSQP